MKLVNLDATSIVDDICVDISCENCPFRKDKIGTMFTCLLEERINELPLVSFDDVIAERNHMLEQKEREAWWEE